MYNKLPIYLGRGPWCSGYSSLFGKSDFAGMSPTVAFKFHRNTFFILLVKI